jgi:hypothetical protein
MQLHLRSTVDVLDAVMFRNVPEIRDDGHILYVKIARKEKEL